MVRPIFIAKLCLDACADALRFFTRLPVPARLGASDIGRVFEGVAAAAPLAGAVVGGVSGAILAALIAMGLPPLASAVFAVAAGVALTGALHEDALADVADGFGGGATRDAKLAIMRDSRIGAYGGSALTLGLVARVALIAALAESFGAGAAFGLAAAAAIARPIALLPTRLLPPARTDGSGHAARASAPAVAIGCGVGLLLAIALAGALPGLGAVALGLAAALGLTSLARRQIGGVTGDVCGAAAHLAEIAALLALVLADRMT